MFAKYLLTAAAAARFARAQGNICNEETITISSSADAEQLSGCDTIEGSVVISDSVPVGQTIDISGPTEIQGDLTASNNGMNSFISSSLATIGGAFTLTNLTSLSKLSMTTLRTVDSISWTTLPALDSLDFGDEGITKAESVVVADTFLSSLDGLALTSVGSMNINNNRRLVEFNSALGNLTQNLNIQANGLNLAMTLPNLTWIANMTISNVTRFEVPVLEVVNGSMRFDSNYFNSLNAPKLTSVDGGDVSFVSNGAVTNISMPVLGTVGGGVTIANNTVLESLTGFPKLKTVGGAVILRGSFNELDLPALNDVKGGVEVVSTADINSACSTLEGLHTGGQIQGKLTCDSNNANANNDTSDDTKGGSSSKKGAASSLFVSPATAALLASLVAVFQLVL